MENIETVQPQLLGPILTIIVWITALILLLYYIISRIQEKKSKKELQTKSSITDEENEIIFLEKLESINGLYHFENIPDLYNFLIDGKFHFSLQTKNQGFFFA